MGTNFSVNKSYLVGELEVTPGTDPTPADADFNVRIRNPEVTLNVEIDDENSKFGTGDHAEDEAIAGMQSATISFSVKMNYAGDVTTQPAWWKLANACGLKSVGWNAGSEVAVGSAVHGISLVPRKEMDESTMTFYYFNEEVGSSPTTMISKFVGCIGNMTISADNVGAPVMANFTFQGKLSDIVDGSALDMTSPDTTLCENMLNSGFTVNGVTNSISAFQFDLGNEISPVLDQSDATGISHYVITARRPRFSCNPLAVKQATDDVHNRLLSETTGILALSTAQYSFYGIKAQLISNAVANREGLVSWDQNYKLLKNGTTGALTNSSYTTEDTFDLRIGSLSA